jgi:hypothetical protein
VITGTYARPQKDINRRDSFLHLRHFSSGRAYRSLLTLPSREALCVHELKRLGMIDDLTHQFWVECDKKRESFLRFEATKFPKDSVDIHMGYLETAPLERNLDLLNADMECTLTPNLGTWLSDIGPRLVPGADVAATFTRWERNNPLYRWLEENQNDCILSDQIRKLRIDLGAADSEIIIPLALLHSALQIEVCDAIGVFPYGDKKRMQMVILALPNVHRGDSPWPTFAEVLAEAKLAERTVTPGERHDPIIMEIVQRGLDRFMMFLAEEDGDLVVRLRQNAVTEIGRYETLEEVMERFQISATPVKLTA